MGQKIGPMGFEYWKDLLYVILIFFQCYTLPILTIRFVHKLESFSFERFKFRNIEMVVGTRIATSYLQTYLLIDFIALWLSLSFIRYNQSLTAFDGGILAFINHEYFYTSQVENVIETYCESR